MQYGNSKGASKRCDKMGRYSYWGFCKRSYSRNVKKEQDSFEIDLAIDEVLH